MREVKHALQQIVRVIASTVKPYVKGHIFLTKCNNTSEPVQLNALVPCSHQNQFAMQTELHPIQFCTKCSWKPFLPAITQELPASLALDPPAWAELKMLTAFTDLGACINHLYSLAKG